MRQTWQTIGRDERGGIGFNALWVCFVLIFLIPFFWDVASVQYARRFAGTGADAGSLAAAQQYASQLQRTMMKNGEFRGICVVESTPQQVVMRYLLTPAFFGAPFIGQGQAQQYAASNRDRLTGYRSWPEPSTMFVSGINIPRIKVAVDTERTVNMAYGIYGREYKTPNKALAVAFLDRWTVKPRPCGNAPPTYDFTFEWKITLDKAR